ncbi:MAG: 50S ribosome-binding GTPase [candidate division Zixibacteria bacterium]|nr:50S ribosome-binding GTPase [candidate division Zixibacteria bacterium]
MPANLPPQYYELEREYRAERDPREKLRLAQELLRMMPKHKGTDKLQADMKSKIARHRKEIAEPAKSGGAAKAAAVDYIPREGAGQIVLIGPPNSGKSSLVDSLTNAKPLVADYPYATREPLAGMMTFETVQIQLIDTPPISDELYETYMSNLVRNADVVLLVVDLADEHMLDRVNLVLERLEERRVLLQPSVDVQPDDPRFMAKKTFICAHKAYEDEDGSRQKALAERFPGFTIVPTSIIDDDAMNALRRALFDSLAIIRVYTKHVGKPVEKIDPVILPIGGTVEEAAIEIHKDFGKKLKFAKIWGEGKFDGQRVNRDYQLTDEDIVEFHI